MLNLTTEDNACIGLISMILHVYNVWNVHSSAGGASAISNEQYCVISSCNIMATTYS